MPGGVARARARSFVMMLSIDTNSTSNGLPTSTSWSNVVPIGWLCVSMKPGTTVMPLASITRVRRSASERTCAVDPTATMRALLTANASARGSAGSMV